ncbi:MAG: polysaccharide export protein [Granulosicoccus sp.]|nr:polysaccharide export protein [Granulosicoccus sp.]
MQHIIRIPLERLRRLTALGAAGLLVAFAALFFSGSALSQQLAGLEYRIGPEDVLHISVWKEEDLDRKVLVRPDGGISFPLVGDIQVSGRTPLEVQDEIRARLLRYVPEAEVTVSVDKISGYTVFVLGEVQSPGQFTLGRYVDVVQALTLAGGTTPYASESKIKILRRQDGREVVYRFSFTDIERGRSLEQNIILQSGDVVVVP